MDGSLSSNNGDDEPNPKSESKSESSDILIDSDSDILCQREMNEGNFVGEQNGSEWKESSIVLTLSYRDCIVQFLAIFHSLFVLYQKHTFIAPHQDCG